MNKLLSLFRRSAKQTTERTSPLNLPEVPQEKLTPAGLAEMLADGIPIWTWTSILDKPNTTALLNLQGNSLDGFAVFLKEDNLLVKYVVIVTSEEDIYLKATEICAFENSNIMEFFNTEIKDAYKVYYDVSGATGNTKCFVHDLKHDDIVDYLKYHRVMFVGEEHFLRKKDNPDAI